MRALPNVITLARAAAVVPMVLLLDSPLAALAVFALAYLTDAVDGPLARRLGVATPLGAFLDPFADKVLVLGALIAFAAHGVIEGWVVLAILGREAMAILLRGVTASRGIALEPSALGKAKAAFQGVAVGAVLLALAIPGNALSTGAAVALFVALVLTMVSGIELVARASAALLPARRAEGLGADAR